MGRVKSEFVVLEEDAIGFYHAVVGNLGSTDEARRWLKENGEEGKAYRLAAFSPGPLGVEIKKIARRKLVAVLSPTDPPQESVDGPDPKD